ncbi:MAG TPA: DUF3891 family protein [Candidatus Acidoferrales bacterium]|nr:DUF3891 family protein [Candidatus Acidoferrales bacterium]
MLRLETETGWWLVTHPDHARLAGAFAERWGNERFLPPEPRARVLKGIARHDDGWTARDAMPQITRLGKPSAFSVELLGKYSAFEEIDLADYLAVRDRALRLIAEEDAYAAILVSMHTYSLLTDHADRSTIAPADLPVLDEFLAGQKKFQASLMQRIAVDSQLAPEVRTEAAILDHFHLLQATDNLSLMTCVDFSQPSNLLHPLPLRSGGYARVEVRSIGTRHFALNPYPFALPAISFRFPARHVVGKQFHSAEDLQRQYNIAPPEMLSVTVSAS